ncbi:type VII secretion-associated serine protease mycosin [Streptomyces sp. ISL-11]|uniref:type VII secretion-associated serine protease mycosin n=1 Tax=Streptomyces sp. ISL-11 TaxID=2819174 RepID=UPI0027E4476F|nr:type VII secretion-associated serine protease mycosin [Streptomyces sp. ISL-11]
MAGALGLLLTGTAAPLAHADTVRSQQWYLDAMHADEMWEVSTGRGITVAVIDTGVDATLPDLDGQVLEGKDFTGQGGDAHTDSFQHGTTIAALIAGSGKRSDRDGSFGLAPGTKILPLRVTDGSEAKNEAEAARGFSATVSAAIRYAADSDAKILNISMGQESDSKEISEAVRYALAKGKLIFAAVGNGGEKGNAAEYPAASPGVVGVSAISRDGTSTKESQSGPQVDLAAPGEEIVSACAGGSELCRSHGTSAATALASASAALIWSVHPNWTANQVTRVLINTAGGATTGEKRTDSIGYGAVRPRIALKDPGDPGPANVNPLPGSPTEADNSPNPTPSKPTGAMPPREESASNAGKALMWTGIGLGVAAAAAAGIAVPVVITRRRRA